MTRYTSNLLIPTRRQLGSSAFILISAITAYGCKSTNPQVSQVKTAEETQREIKSDVASLLAKPAENLISLLTPLATQFKSVQQIKAQAEGALGQASNWAREQLADVKNQYNQNAILWQVATIFAGPDGLLNYQDVKNTLACMPDQEIKAAIDYALSEESAHANGYKKEAIELLRRNIAENNYLPAFEDSLNPIAMLNSESRPRAIKNEINRQIARTLAEQCAIPRQQIFSAKTFDLIKKHCFEALDWRSQGFFVGLLHLHHEGSSIDKGGSCSNRIMTFKMFRELYDKYIKPNANGGSSKGKYAAAMDFLHLQATKYFGPLDPAVKPIQLVSTGEDRISNHYLDISEAAQVTLKGGMPVSAMKGLMDDFASGKNNLLRGDLGQMSRSLKTTMDCKSTGNLFVPKKSLGTEKLDFTYYENEEEFRAYFDPSINGESYLRSKISDLDRLRNAIETAKTNKINAVLKKSLVNGTTYFLHQTLSGIYFVDERVSTLAISRFEKLADGRIRLNTMYLEQATGNTFTVSIQRPDGSGGFELAEYEGYAVPYTSSSESFITPCIEFSGIK